MADRTLTGRVADAAACDTAWMDQLATVRQHRRQHLAPHLAAAGLLAAGFTAELVALLTGSAALVAAVIAILTVGTMAVAAIPTVRARIPARYRRRLLIAGLTSSTWLTMAASGVSWDMITALLLAEYALAAGWWREHRLPHHTDAPVTAAAAPTPSTEIAVFEQRFADRVATNAAKGIKGGVLSNGSVDAGIYTWTLTLQNGETLTDVQGRAASIASLMGLPASALVFDPIPLISGQLGDESRIRMQIVTASPVSVAVPYQVPVVSDGRVPLGPWADGRGVATMPMVVRNGVRHAVFIGSTGTGKSSTVNGAVVTLRANYPVVTLYFDPKSNSSPDLRKNSTIALLGLDDAEEFTTAVERLCEGRGLESAYNDWSGYTPSRQRPIYLVVIDECDMLFGLAGMGRRWGLVAKTGRALGVKMLVATQYAGTRAFGNDEMLRSNLAKNVLLMRTDSNTSDNLIAPGLPPSRFLPSAPGYAYLQAEDARRAPLRSAVLRSSDDAEPGEEHVGVLLERYPDAEVDAIGRMALGELLVPRAEREAASRSMVRRKLAAFLAGDFTGAKQDTGLVDAEDIEAYGQVIAFPSALVPDSVPDSQAGLTGAQQAVYAAITAGNTRPVDIQRATGWGETYVANQLKALISRGLVSNPRFGRYVVGTEDTAETA